MIEVKDLVKRYGGHLAVDHLSFSVEPGQIYGFLGPNGAGKSTTMNIMTGYLGATSGQVIINGHDIQEEPEEAKSCIGYLPELPPIYGEMTVTEQLLFAAELKKIPKKDRKAQLEQVIEMCHLENVRGRLIRNLSKGYKQRVGLAQAIIGFPDIIILDEPTVGLDPMQIIEIRDLMRTLAEKHTVILSSHILSEVQEVCDKILIINKGRLIACDTPANLERQMNGGNRLELSVRGTREQVESLLAGIEGINSVEFTEGEQELGVAVISDSDTDLREILFYAFADARCPILTMKYTEISLENVFLQLTGSDENAPAADETAEGETSVEEPEPEEEDEPADEAEADEEEEA